MSRTNYIPVAMSDVDYQNPAVQESLATLLCDVFGFPYTDEAKARTAELFKMTKRTNVVGNVDEGVLPGTDWWVSADSAVNMIGDNVAQAQAILDDIKSKPKQGDPKFGSITEEPEWWFRAWGTYAEPVQP